MGSIGWDIVRTTLGVFLLILLSLTALVWLATVVAATHLLNGLATDCATVTARLTRRLATL
jgi:lipopolysaccharide export LptBFGC system permease protein LptF